MILVENRAIPKIEIPNSLVESEAKDPYLCPWAEWYYLVIMAYWLQDKKNARACVEQNIHTCSVVHENSATSLEQVSVLHKGFLIPGSTHQNWFGERETKTGASTALILNGNHRGMIVIPGQIGYSVGRTLDPSRAYEPFYELKAKSKLGDLQIEYTEAQKKILDEAVQSTDNNLRKLFNVVSKALSAVEK